MKKINYRGYTIQTVNATVKSTGEKVIAYKVFGKVYRHLVTAQQQIDLYRLFNIKEVDC